MSSLNSSVLNCLVFRYLNESGFIHSAFMFGYEAGINRNNLDNDAVPIGALVTYIQNGIRFVEFQVNSSNSGTTSDEDFILLTPTDILTKSVDELREMVKERRRASGKGKGIADQDESPKINPEDYERTGEEPMNFSTPSTSQPSEREIPNPGVTILRGHASEVCAIAWHPTGPFLATGSGDSTARIWNITDGSSGSSRRTPHHSCVVLKHAKSDTSVKSKDVTSLNWNGGGTLLATGSCDGKARIWSKNGVLRSILSKHQGAIVSLKWNNNSDYLLTAGCDKTAIVWDVKSGVCKQQFEFHSGPVLDVDWRNKVSFATSSVDKMVHVFKIGQPGPIKTYSKHEGEVNSVRWDPSGTYLASGSDDTTVKIWSIRHDKCVSNLAEHTQAIYTVRWSPTGRTTSYPNKPLVLASASIDSTVKIWDWEIGKCRHTLAGHTGPVYCIAFSPDGDYLASGSVDKTLQIWSLKECKIVKTYTGDGSVFDVCWNKNGDKVAGCFSDKSVCVLDFRM